MCVQNGGTVRASYDPFTLAVIWTIHSCIYPFIQFVESAHLNKYFWIVNKIRTSLKKCNIKLKYIAAVYHPIIINTTKKWDTAYIQEPSPGQRTRSYERSTGFWPSWFLERQCSIGQKLQQKSPANQHSLANRSRNMSILPDQIG